MIADQEESRTHRLACRCAYTPNTSELCDAEGSISRRLETPQKSVSPDCQAS